MTLQNFSSNAESHARTFSTTRLLVKCTLLTLVLIAHCTHISDFAPMIWWKCVFIILFWNIVIFSITKFLVKNWKRKGNNNYTRSHFEDEILTVKQYIILSKTLWVTWFIAHFILWWDTIFEKTCLLIEGPLIAKKVRGWW